jgi:glycosyltransferase involved in cell wall biosynthesis
LEQTHPLVTIIIPVFNGSDFLRSAIDAAVAQTWPAIEVLVVDDGSQDNGATREVAESYGDKIRYLHKENGGVGSALNLGLTEMRGDYASWLSHDDFYDPRKIELQMLKMREHAEPVVVFGDYDCMLPDGGFLSRSEVGPRFDPRKPLWAVLEGLINGCTLLIPRICFEKTGLFDSALPQTQDYDLWYRLAQHYRFVHCPGALVRYRVHPNQASQSIRHIDEASLLWLRMLETLDPAVMRAYEGDELRFMIRAGRFVSITGYDGAKAGVPALVERYAADQPIGVALVVKTRREVLLAHALMAETGLRHRLLVIDLCDDPLEAIALTDPELARSNAYCRFPQGAGLYEVMKAAALHLDTSLVAFVSGFDVTAVEHWRRMYESLTLNDALDGLLLQPGLPKPKDGVLGAFNGAVLRRGAIDRAMERLPRAASASFHHILALHANFDLAT